MFENEKEENCSEKFFDFYDFFSCKNYFFKNFSGKKNFNFK